MTNIIYMALLFIFCFGAITTGINELGIYDIKVPTTQAGMSTNNVHQLSESMNEAQKNPITGGLEMLGIFFKSVWGGITGLFSIGLLLEAYGIPAGVYGMLISPLGFVVIWWIGEYFLGRSPE